MRKKDISEQIEKIKDDIKKDIFKPNRDELVMDIIRILAFQNTIKGTK